MKSKIKQLLLLIARILTIIFLVFAFAQPYIPSNKDVQKKANQTVAIYIDNSFSMNALSEQGQLLELARNKAVEIVLAYPAGTKFRLFTNDLKPKHQHLFNKEQFIQQVAEIQTSPIVLPLSLIYNRFAIQKLEEEVVDKSIYFISDFQTTISDVENFADETIFSYYIPLVPNQVANIFIDSLQFFNALKAKEYLEDGFVNIYSGGTSNPFVTTDTSAVLKALETDSDILVKATKVAGVYDSDPVKNKNAKFYKQISYLEVLKNKLKVMDSTAMSMAMDNKLPVAVVDFLKKDNLLNFITGQDVGTIIK